MAVTHSIANHIDISNWLCNGVISWTIVVTGMLVFLHEGPSSVPCSPA